MITYDLNSPGQRYDAVAQAIKDSCSTWCHPLNNVWFIVTDLTPTEVRDKIVAETDNSDEVLVVKATAPGAWHNLSNDCADWLLKYL